MDVLINPLILFGSIALGGVGVAIALPRKGMNPQVLGALLAAIGAGGIILALTLLAGPDHPSLFFYIFGLIGLGSALRVITHHRPVYAALWFVMVILSTAGLLVLLSAEFMTAALVIVYAGAILITYLFVIMLATQAPEEGESESVAAYDVQAREPIVATVVGFVILAVLTTMLFRGVGDMRPPPAGYKADALLERMPRKIDNVLRNAGKLDQDERSLAIVPLDLVPPPDRAGLEMKDGDVFVKIATRGDPGIRYLPSSQWPDDLRVKNVEALGFNLLSDHPGTIEIAGVILLMAMLGAVVLSRKQVQLDEDAKLRQARSLAGPHSGGEGTA